MARGLGLLLLVALFAALILGGGSGWKGPLLSQQRESSSVETAELEGAPLDSEAGAARQREAAGPELARLEVVAILPDGSERPGQVTRYWGPELTPGVAAPSEDGRTWVEVEAGRTVHLGVVVNLNDMAYEGAATVSAAKDEIVRVKVQAKSIRVHGRITRGGVAQPRIGVWLQSVQGNTVAYTDTDGTYEITLNGDLRGRLLVGNREDRRASFGLGVNVEHEVQLSMRVGESRRIDVDLAEGALTLLVVDRNGRPRANAAWVQLIQAMPPESSVPWLRRTVTADDAGKVRFPGLPAGDYWVQIHGYDNRPKPPSRVRVHHPGGDHEAKVQIQGLASLQVLVRKATADGWEFVRSPVWVMEREGVAEQPWEDEFMSGSKSQSGEFEGATHRLTPGLLKLRAGAPHLGYGDALVSLVEGETEEVIIDLSEQGPLLTLRFEESQVESLSDLYFTDWSGRLLASVGLFELSLEKVKGTDPLHVDARLRLPHSGSYVVYAGFPTAERRLGEIYVQEEGASWVVPQLDAER